MKVLLDHAGLLRLIYGWETSDDSRHHVAVAPARVIVAFLQFPLRPSTHHLPRRV